MIRIDKPTYKTHWMRTVLYWLGFVFEDRYFDRDTGKELVCLHLVNQDAIVFLPKVEAQANKEGEV